MFVRGNKQWQIGVRQRTRAEESGAAWCGAAAGKGRGDTSAIGLVRYPRIVALDAECAAKLAKRTLTNLYNERPTWLDLAHRKLDEAVCAAYGWPAEALTREEEILKRLLALNLERAEEEKK